MPAPEAGRFRGRLRRRIRQAKIHETVEIRCRLVGTGLHRYGCGLLRHTFSNRQEGPPGLRASPLGREYCGRRRRRSRVGRGGWCSISAAHQRVRIAGRRLEAVSIRAHLAVTSVGAVLPVLTGWAGLTLRALGARQASRAVGAVHAIRAIAARRAGVAVTAGPPVISCLARRSRLPRGASRAG